MRNCDLKGEVQKLSVIVILSVCVSLEGPGMCEATALTKAPPFSIGKKSSPSFKN